MFDLLQSGLWLVAVIALVATDLLQSRRIRYLEQRVRSLEGLVYGSRRDMGGRATSAPE